MQLYHSYQRLICAILSAVYPRIQNTVKLLCIKLFCKISKMLMDFFNLFALPIQLRLFQMLEKRVKRKNSMQGLHQCSSLFSFQCYFKRNSLVGQEILLPSHIYLFFKNCIEIQNHNFLITLSIVMNIFSRLNRPTFRMFLKTYHF